MALTKAYFDSRMDEMTSFLKGLQKDNQLLKLENKCMREELNKLKANMVRIDLQNRKHNLVFHGIPKLVNDNPQLMVQEVIKTKLDISDADNIPISKCYRIKMKEDRGAKKGTDPIFVSFKNSSDCDLLTRNCGKLKKTGISISSDLPPELARRRKELLSQGYKLKNSTGRDKVLQTKVVQKGIKLWLETKKTRSAQWVKFKDDCYEFLQTSAVTSAIDQDQNDSEL